jgi:hypothetical protein
MEVKNNRNFQILPLNENAEKVLREATEQLKVKYWMSAGTALGLYRDKDFVEGDTDIDIALVGYEGVEKDLLDWEIIRTVYHEGKPQQIAYVKDGVIFDVYIHWLEGDDYVNYGESGKQRMVKWMYDEQVILETKYGLLPFPKDPEKYFEIRYGDWKVKQDKKANYERI